MKKKIFTAVLLVLMIGALMMFTTGCGAEDTESADRRFTFFQYDVNSDGLTEAIEIFFLSKPL